MTWMRAWGRFQLRQLEVNGEELCPTVDIRLSHDNDDDDVLA